MAKNIVIVGAGYAGILTAKQVEKRLRKCGKLDEVKIQIIDRHPYHTMLTELHEVAAGRVNEDSIRIDLAQVFARRQVEVVLDTVTDIDFEKRSVCGTQKSYPYDYLVLAAGSKPTFFGTPGAEHAKTLWSYEDAVALREHTLSCFRQAAMEPDSAKRAELLTFFVVGAGFTGVEMAGELAEWVPILCERFHLDRNEVTIYNCDMLSRTVPVLTEKQSMKVEKRLAKMGVTVKLNTGVKEIGADFVICGAKDAKPERIATKTVIWAAGIEAADITTDVSKKLTSPERSRGRIQVTPYLNVPEDEHTYVVGDNMFFVPEGETMPVPQMVENCEQSSHCCAVNIAADITDGDKHTYKPKNHGVMVCIGGRYGVANVGTDKHKFNLASFFAMFSKHFINVIYFMQVLGWTKVFSYIKHEFFTIRHNRSFVGGHFSNVTPSFLLVLLRFWLGAVWVYEGVMKIVEGWFVKPSLSGFFGGATGWFDSILNPGAVDATTVATGAGAAVADAATAATGAVADAATAATGAVTGAVASVGQAIINWDLWLVQIQFVCGKAPEHASLMDYALRFNVPIMNWFIAHTVTVSDGTQLFFQGFIVVLEILIGLGLMGGLFTSLSAGISLVLQMMFIMTTGLYLGTFWMIFAAIACLIGAGRTIGLDYYAMPGLKRLWKKNRIVKRWYLYHD